MGFPAPASKLACNMSCKSKQAGESSVQIMMGRPGQYGIESKKEVGKTFSYIRFCIYKRADKVEYMLEYDLQGRIDARV